MVFRQRACFLRQYSTALYCQPECRPCEAATPQYGPSRVRPRSGEETTLSAYACETTEEHTISHAGIQAPE